MNFCCFSNSNPAADARSFVGEKRIAVVVANQNRKESVVKTRVNVDGAKLVDWSVLGNAEVSKSGTVKLGQYDLAVLIFEK